MRYPFKTTGPLIIVTMRLEHGGKAIDVEAALDTGCATTVASSSILEYLGCSPIPGEKRRIITASGIEWCSVYCVDKVTSCGKEVSDIEIVCHDLPPASTIRGLLGENFLKHFDLRIDYKHRFVELK